MIEGKIGRDLALNNVVRKVIWRWKIYGSRAVLIMIQLRF